MIDQDKIMVADGGNIMRKTPQDEYDLIEKMTQHHFQWDAEVYYDTTTGVSAHYSETTFALSAQPEVLGKQTAYTIQSVQHQPGPGHPHTVYYSDSDESDEDEPFEVLDIQKPIHFLSGNPTTSSDSVVESLSPLPTPSGINEGLDDIISIPPGKEINHLDAIPDSVQSLLNRANSILFLIEEFAGELAPIDPIPPGIVEADFDPEEDFCLIKKLLNDDSSPHSSEKLNSEISDAIIESFSPSLIPVEDSASFMEEIDIFLAPDDSIPPGIEKDDYDSEGDVLFLEELLNDDSISFPEYESFHVDFYNVPSSPRPPKNPLENDVYFDIEPDTGVLTTKVVADIFDNSTRELYVHVPNVLPTLPTFYPVFDTLFPFLSKKCRHKVFNLEFSFKDGESPHLFYHRGFNVFRY
ncbi:hypothetical protein Tco_0153262 [Tanacetum coccineum]